MAWPAFWLGLVVIATPVTLVAIGGARFRRRVRDEMRALLAVPASLAPLANAVQLPPPVMRYRTLAVGAPRPVRTLLMRHGGTFRRDTKSESFAIQGTQLFTFGPAGFVWCARMHVAPMFRFDGPRNAQAMGRDMP